ncbi:MAG: hypothetical protein BWK76_18420 [Desulfobulbaceae bacterium A2]|nr:MAG: hypothetical protein BWK76_18420 [Desulfobulbaceae bacterium A2]
MALPVGSVAATVSVISLAARRVQMAPGAEVRPGPSRTCPSAGGAATTPAAASSLACSGSSPRTVTARSCQPASPHTRGRAESTPGTAAASRRACSPSSGSQPPACTRRSTRVGAWASTCAPLWASPPVNSSGTAATAATEARARKSSR